MIVLRPATTRCSFISIVLFMFTGMISGCDSSPQKLIESAEDGTSGRGIDSDTDECSGVPENQIAVINETTPATQGADAERLAESWVKEQFDRAVSSFEERQFLLLSDNSGQVFLELDMKSPPEVKAAAVDSFENAVANDYQVVVDYFRVMRQRLMRQADIFGESGANNDSIVVTVSLEFRARAKGKHLASHPLPGILPWTDFVKISRTCKVFLSADDGDYKVEGSSIEFEPLSQSQIAKTANIEQSFALSGEVKDVFQKFKERFNRVFRPRDDRYFLDLFVAVIPWLEEVGTPHFVALHEVAGVHQIWVESIDLPENAQLNGLRSAYKCTVGVRGFKRNVEFVWKNDRDMNLADSFRWGDWNARKEYFGEWYFLQIKDDYTLISNDLGIYADEVLFNSFGYKAFGDEVEAPARGQNHFFGTRPSMDEFIGEAVSARLNELRIYPRGESTNVFCDDDFFVAKHKGKPVKSQWSHIKMNGIMISGIASRDSLADFLKQLEYERVEIEPEVADLDSYLMNP